MQIIYMHCASHNLNGGRCTATKIIHGLRETYIDLQLVEHHHPAAHIVNTFTIMWIRSVYVSIRWNEPVKLCHLRRMEHREVVFLLMGLPAETHTLELSINISVPLLYTQIIVVYGWQHGKTFICTYVHTIVISGSSRTPARSFEILLMETNHGLLMHGIGEVFLNFTLSYYVLLAYLYLLIHARIRSRPIVFEKMFLESL